MQPIAIAFRRGLTQRELHEHCERKNLAEISLNIEMSM